MDFRENYEKKMEETMQEHRKKFNEREANTNLKMEELNREIKSEKLIQFPPEVFNMGSLIIWSSVLSYKDKSLSAFTL